MISPASLIFVLGVGLSFLLLNERPTTAQSSAIQRIATNLQNPRGVAVLPNGRLLLAEAGTGYVSTNPADNSGKLSVLDDHNRDGDYDDIGERVPIVEHLPGYNILYQFNPGRDEIVGVRDVLVLPDGRIFFTLDDHFETLSIVELTPRFERVGHFYRSGSTLNSIAYDASRQHMYVAESTSTSPSWSIHAAWARGRQERARMGAGRRKSGVQRHGCSTDVPTSLGR